MNSNNQPKPQQSDDGLRAALHKVKHLADNTTNPRGAIRSAGEIAAAALSQAYAPVPKGETANFIQEVPGSAKFNDPVAQSAYEMGIRHGKALAAPVPTSGGGE